MATNNIKPNGHGQEKDNSRTSLLLEHVGEAFNNLHLADVKIFLGTLELPAHRLVLAAQSDYFKTAFKSSLKEDVTSEFRFDDGDLQAYWRVFQYMYTGDYSEESQPTVDMQDDDELLKDVRVYALANYFIVEGLKDFALQRFQAKVEKLWLSEKLVDCIRNIYDSTSDPDCKMRKTVVNTVYVHIDDLWQRKSLQDLLRDGGDFVVDLMGEMMARKGVSRAR